MKTLVFHFVLGLGVCFYALAVATEPPPAPAPAIPPPPKVFKSNSPAGTPHLATNAPSLPTKVAPTNSFPILTNRPKPHIHTNGMPPWHKNDPFFRPSPWVTNSPAGGGEYPWHSTTNGAEPKPNPQPGSKGTSDRFDSPTTHGEVRP